MLKKESPKLYKPFVNLLVVLVQLRCRWTARVAGVCQPFVQSPVHWLYFFRSVFHAIGNEKAGGMEPPAKTAENYNVAYLISSS